MMTLVWVPMSTAPIATVLGKTAFVTGPVPRCKCSGLL
jgi:hypothetical protein